MRQPLRALGYVSKQPLNPELQELVLAELNVKELDARLLNSDTRPQTVATAVGAGNIQTVYLDLTMTDELKAEGLAQGTGTLGSGSAQKKQAASRRIG